MQFIIRDDHHPHAPSGEGGEHPAKLLPGKFLVVDLNLRLDRAVFGVAGVPDEATQDVAAHRPLAKPFVVFDLVIKLETKFQNSDDAFENRTV